MKKTYIAPSVKAVARLDTNICAASDKIYHKDDFGGGSGGYSDDDEDVVVSSKWTTFEL